MVRRSAEAQRKAGQRYPVELRHKAIKFAKANPASTDQQVADYVGVPHSAAAYWLGEARKQKKLPSKTFKHRRSKSTALVVQPPTPAYVNGAADHEKDAVIAQLSADLQTCRSMLKMLLRND